ncbi:MAG: DUF1801 domain-containing protein [Acidaminobacteraceae bacterium]
MNIEAKTIDEYIEKVPENRKEAFIKLRDVIKANIPDGFEETMSYGMIGYVVPHSIYPDGYHCDPSLPLPFINIGIQKNFIGVYHSGIYAVSELEKWFRSEYAKRCKYKIDMGKSCIRLKKNDDIPYELIAELVRRISLDEWISIYGKATSK